MENSINSRSIVQKDASHRLRFPGVLTQVQTKGTVAKCKFCSSPLFAFQGSHELRFADVSLALGLFQA